MTQARARSEGSAIIIEYESDKTQMPNEALLTATDVENSFFARNKKEVDKKAGSIQ